MVTTNSGDTGERIGTSCQFLFSYDAHLFGRQLAQYLGQMASRDPRGNGSSQLQLFEDVQLQTGEVLSCSQIQIVRKGPRRGKAVGWPKDTPNYLKSRPFVEVLEGQTKQELYTDVLISISRLEGDQKEVLMRPVPVSTEDLIQFAMDCYETLSA